MNPLYFTPTLLHNRKIRKSLLLPLYEKKVETEACCVSKGGNTPAPSISNNEDKTVVYMALKETPAVSGLCDRLRAIVPIYEECKRQGLPFRIHFDVPELEEFLVPNKYDWRIQPEEIIYDTERVYPCSILTYHKDIKDRWQWWVQNRILRHFIAKNKQQIHVYSNMLSSDEHYAELFAELFKPSDDLQKELDIHLEKLGGKGNYIAVKFRFLQLFGDFKDGGGETLSPEEQKIYMERGILTLQKLHEQYPDKHILLATESSTFNKEAEKLPYVYVIPGEIVHFGFALNAAKAAYMKTFVDLLMISYAEEVFLVRDEKMFHSGFAFWGSRLSGTKYSEVWME